MPKKTHPPKAGMWSTIDAAVQGGWGHVWRLICILAVVGLIAITLAILGSVLAPTHLMTGLSRFL